jgi:hypothetical protein
LECSNFFEKSLTGVQLPDLHICMVTTPTTFGFGVSVRLIGDMLAALRVIPYDRSSYKARHRSGELRLGGTITPIPMVGLSGMIVPNNPTIKHYEQSRQLVI